MVREAQKSESGPKGKEQAKSKKQVQGNHEGIKRPRRLEAQTKKHPEEKKKKHGKRIRSQDPQQPLRSADPSRHTVKRRLGQFKRKGQKKENKKQRIQAQKKTRDLLWHKQIES